MAPTPCATAYATPSPPVSESRVPGEQSLSISLERASSDASPLLVGCLSSASLAPERRKSDSHDQSLGRTSKTRMIGLGEPSAFLEIYDYISISCAWIAQCHAPGKKRNWIWMRAVSPANEDAEVISLVVCGSTSRVVGFLRPLKKRKIGGTGNEIEEICESHS